MGEYLFYKREKKKIVPVTNKKLNRLAKLKLEEIRTRKNNIPSRFVENWEEVKLFESKGNIKRAKSLILNVDDGNYSLNNKLNELTGKQWIKFTCSWFIFNALSSDLKKEKDLMMNLEEHPATFSPTMISEFIKFFTKEGMSVLDPFAGIGSTLEACKRTKRIGFGIELNKKYSNIIKKRTPEFKENIINTDSRNIKKYFGNLKFNFCISSPPYWDVLNRSTKDFRVKRSTKNLDINYSEDLSDLGNITNYDSFLEELTQIYLDIFDLMENNSYIVIIVKNIKKDGKVYTLAWDLAKKLAKKFTLKDEKIWIQDKIALAPYGYPNGWTSNILHHYCIILKKEENGN